MLYQTLSFGYAVLMNLSHKKLVAQTNPLSHKNPSKLLIKPLRVSSPLKHRNTSYLQCWVKEEEEPLRKAIVIREGRKKYVMKLDKGKWKWEWQSQANCWYTFFFLSPSSLFILFFCAFYSPTLLSLNLRPDLEGAGVDLYQGIEIEILGARGGRSWTLISYGLWTVAIRYWGFDFYFW